MNLLFVFLAPLLKEKLLFGFTFVHRTIITLKQSFCFFKTKIVSKYFAIYFTICLSLKNLHSTISQSLLDFSKLTLLYIS